MYRQYSDPIHSEFVVYQEQWTYITAIVPALLISGVLVLFGKSTKAYFQGHVAIAWLVALAIVIACLLLFKEGLKRTVQLVISPTGIRFSKKGTFTWSEIDFCYFRKTQPSDSGSSTLFRIKLLGTEKEVSVYADLFDKSEPAIKKAIESYCGDRKMIVLLSEDN